MFGAVELDAPAGWKVGKAGTRGPARTSSAWPPRSRGPRTARSPRSSGPAVEETPGPGGPGGSALRLPPVRGPEGRGRGRGRATHEKNDSEIGYAQAASQALRQAMQTAGSISAARTGDVLRDPDRRPSSSSGDDRRSGRLAEGGGLGRDARRASCAGSRATVPLFRSMFGYASALRSLSQGRAGFLPRCRPDSAPWPRSPSSRPAASSGHRRAPERASTRKGPDGPRNPGIRGRRESGRPSVVPLPLRLRKCLGSSVDAPWATR